MACVSAAPYMMMAMPHANAAPKYASPTAADSPRKNPYRVVRELGSGLQGRVVLALDERLNQYVAVKLPTAFPSSASLNEKADLRLLEYQVQSIMQERNAQRNVDHENVIKCLKMVPGKKHNRSYVALVTEFAANGDLFDMIADNGALPQPVAKFYFHQLMRGVQACHNSGVVHRDIKPENILFDEKFTLKICDFGLAVTADDDEHADAVTLRDVSGTALYMAPEVCATKTFRGTPVDVWACGVVLFIILTSFPPFQDPREGDFWYDCIMSGRMDIFWASQPENMPKTSPYAMDLINRMLCPDPARRITVPEILAHPWLSDVGRINRSRVVQEMNRRRQRSLAQNCEM